MKLPWMKFYPSDWLSDEALRGCTPAARGLWVDMICLMAKSKRHGYLLSGDKPMTPEHLSRIFGQSLETTGELLIELAQAGVYSMSENTIFSRRMTKDERGRKSNRERVLRWRNGNVMRMKLKCNENVMGQKSEATEARDQKLDFFNKKKRFVPPTEQEWCDYAKQKYLDWDINNMKSAWAHYESIGWKTNTKSFTRWKGCVATCYHGWKQRNGNKSPQKQSRPEARPKSIAQINYYDREPWDYFVDQGYGTADDWIAAGRPSNSVLKYCERGGVGCPERLMKFIQGVKNESKA
jgi:hypothetical protein